jgi:hypothetical protein
LTDYQPAIHLASLTPRLSAQEEGLLGNRARHLAISQYGVFVFTVEFVLKLSESSRKCFSKTTPLSESLSPPVGGADYYFIHWLLVRYWNYSFVILRCQSLWSVKFVVISEIHTKPLTSEIDLNYI